MTKVLIIDDDRFVLDAAEAGLRKAGYETHSFSDARAALKFLKEEGADLLITDILMPEMDGFELIQAVHAIRPGLPILAQSSCNVQMGTNTLRVAQMLGAARCLEKPYTSSELLAAVADALAGPPTR